MESMKDKGLAPTRELEVVCTMPDGFCLDCHTAKSQENLPVLLWAELYAAVQC